MSEKTPLTFINPNSGKPVGASSGIGKVMASLHAKGETLASDKSSISAFVLAVAEKYSSLESKPPSDDVIKEIFLSLDKPFQNALSTLIPEEWGGAGKRAALMKRPVKIIAKDLYINSRISEMEKTTPEVNREEIEETASGEWAKLKKSSKTSSLEITNKFELEALKANEGLTERIAEWMKSRKGKKSGGETAGEEDEESG